MASLSDKVAIQFSSRFVVQGLQILDGILLARWLTASGMATFGQVFLVTTLLMPLFGTMGGGIGYFFPRLDRARQKGLLAQSIAIGLLAGLLAAAVIFLVAEPLGQRFQNPALPDLLRLFCLFPVLVFPTYFFGQFTICANRNVTGACVSGIGKLAHSAIIATCLFTGASLGVLLAGLLIYHAALMLFSTAYAARFYRDTPMHWDRSMLRSQFTYTIPIALAAATGVLSRELDKVIASAFFVPSMVAIYLVGAREVPVLFLVAGSISSIIFPEMSRHLAEGNPHKAAELWAESIRKQAMVAIPTFIFLMIFAVEFTVTLYGRKYAESAGVFRIYLLVLPLRCVLWSLMLSAAGITRPLFWAASLSLASNLALGLLAIHLFGILGAAIGTVGSVVVEAGYCGWVTWRRVNVNILACFPWRFMLRLSAISLGVSLLLIPLRLIPLRSEILFMVALPAFSAAVSVLVLVLGCLTEYEKSTFKRWLSPLLLWQTRLKSGAGRS